MKNIRTAILCGVLALSVVVSVQAQTPAPAAPPAATGRKPRVAVVDFDYATVHSNVSAIFGSERRRRQGRDRPAGHVSGQGRDLFGHRAQGARQDPRGAELLEQRSGRRDARRPRSASCSASTPSSWAASRSSATTPRTPASAASAAGSAASGSAASTRSRARPSSA